MFNLGFTHLLILGVIALVVIGPEQLPEMARKLAKLLNELRRAKDDIMAPMTEFHTETQKLVNEAQQKATQDISKLLEMREKLDAEIRSQQKEQGLHAPEYAPNVTAAGPQPAAEPQSTAEPPKNLNTTAPQDTGSIPIAKDEKKNHHGE
jgi:sec-independent protein translocase protein TatB